VKERFYDRLNGSLDRKGLAERRERLVGSLTGDVLEVGAGTGLNVPRYRCARRLVAVEPDHQYLRRLRARAADAAIPVEVIQASAETLPLPDDSFDHVVTCISLCSVTDIDAALTQIHRVLRPRGSLMFLEHIRDSGRLGHWQHRLTPLQRRIADNCHLDRDTPAAIQNAVLLHPSHRTLHNATRTPPHQTSRPRQRSQTVQARPPKRRAAQRVAQSPAEPRVLLAQALRETIGYADGPKITKSNSGPEEFISEAHG
jgi:ubiquinone/menaquinone biosynthesis C-methylase UbiE